MSESSVYAHCSSWYLGVHGSGVGIKSGADGSVRAPLGVRKCVSIMSGRSRQDVLFQCVGKGVHREPRSTGSVSVRITDIVHVMVLRSVH